MAAKQLLWGCSHNLCDPHFFLFLLTLYTTLNNVLNNLIAKQRTPHTNCTYSWSTSPLAVMLRYPERGGQVTINIHHNNQTQLKVSYILKMKKPFGNVTLTSTWFTMQHLLSTRNMKESIFTSWCLNSILHLVSFLSFPYWPTPFKPQIFMTTAFILLTLVPSGKIWMKITTKNIDERAQMGKPRRRLRQVFFN